MPQTTIPVARLALAWSVLLGAMVGFWFVRPYVPDAQMVVQIQFLILWTTSKFATLLCMSPDDRHRLSWTRWFAYLLWPGMQPRHFLPEHAPVDADPKPTVYGVVVNSLAAILFLWIIPALMPVDWPRGLRVASATTGYLFLLLFAIFDIWGLLFRAFGLGVEKLWNNPLRSTSLMEFWGDRWNRIFSGMLREVLFLPLARRIGATFALFAVFLYSGILHENFSVAAGRGFGLPMLYFVIQGFATWLETRRPFRRMLKRRPWVGWAWTLTVVVGPCLMLGHEGFRKEVLVPTLAKLGVPGLAAPV